MSSNDKYGFEIHVEITKAKHLVDKNGIRRKPGANFVYEKDGEADERKPFSAWPVVQVECLGEFQYTDYVEESDSPTFDRQFIFKKEWDEVREADTDITLQQFAKKNISFKILDASTWRRDLVLGEYTLNVEDIMKDERAVPPLDAPPGTTNGSGNSRITGNYGTALRNVWLCMHEPITVAKTMRMRGAGFLQVSVSILKKVPNDIMQKLPPLPLPLTNLQRFLQAAYIVPVPSARFSGKGIMRMETELMELVVRVFKAEDIPLSKKKGVNAPYVRVLFNGHGNTNDTFLRLEDYDRSNLSHRKGQQASQYPTLTGGSYSEMQQDAPGRGALGADTNIAQSGPNPVWNQEVRIPFTTYDEYTVLENVAVQIRDRRHTASIPGDDKAPDHLLATHRMSLNNIRTEPRDDVGGGWAMTWDSGVNYKDVRKVLPAPFWINFYGSQDAGMQSLLEAQMNEGNDMDGSVQATDYKGRLLVQMFVERVKKDPDESASAEPVAENDRVRYFVNLENEKDTSSDIGQAFGQKSGVPKRRTVTVTCNRIDTVRDIIKAIDQQHPSLHGIADPSTIKHMELSFDGERLEHNAIMTKEKADLAKKEPDVRDGSSPLSLKWPPGKIQRLNIRMPNGVEQDGSTTSLYMARPGEGAKGVKVREFKELLSKRIGHKPEMYDLAYGERMRHDDDDLGKLRNNDVMYLHWKIRLRHAEWSDQMYADVNRPAYYTMKFDLFQGQGFPEKVKGYELYVKAVIGNHTFPGKAESEPRKVQKSTNGLYNFVQWGQSFEIPWLRLPADDAELPDVLVYVYQREVTDDVASRKPVGTTKDTRLGFLRLSVKNKSFPFNQRDPIWMPLTPDRLSPAWNEQLVMRDGPKLCGALQFRLQFGARTEGSQHVVGVTRQLEWDSQLNQGLGANAPQRRTETLGDVARQYRVSSKEVLDLNRENMKGKVKTAVLERFDRLVKQGGSSEDTIELKNDGDSAKSWKALVPAFFEALWKDDRASQPQSPQECLGFQQQSGALAQAFKRLHPNERKFVWFKLRKLLYNPRESEPLFNQVQLLQGEKLDVPSKLLTESQTAQAGRLKAPETHTYELRCYVYQAQDLPVQNDLLPDPYVEISIGPKTIKTKPITKSAYPVFNQMLQLDDVELNLNPGNENHTDFLKNINDYSRFAEYITVKVKDADPLVDDTTLGRFEVRLAEVDIVRNSDYQRWERTQKLAEAKYLLDPNENPPPKWTKAALQQYLAMRKGPYDKKFKETNEEPLRDKEAMPTEKDWWPVIPVRDEMGREVRIRDDDYDMLSSRELRTRAQGQCLVWFQLLHKDQLKENTHHISLADESGKEVTHKTRSFEPPATLNANSSEKELLDWWEKLERKLRKDAKVDQPGPGDFYRRPHPAQVMAELVPPPRFDTIAPPGHNCMVEYQVFGVKDLKPVNGRPLERPYIEVDTGSMDDPTKRMRTKKVKVLTEEQADSTANNCAVIGGSYANHLETLRVQVRVPESLLFSPTFQVRVYDFRDGGTNKVLVGSAAVPMAKFLPETWICRNKRLTREQRLEYVHDWSIKSPLYRRLQVLALDKSQTQMAKDAFHAELLNDLAVQKFKSIQVGDQELDPSMLDNSSRKGPHRERFRRNMRVAQLAYMSNWEEHQLEEDQALKDIMGAERFEEHKSRKAKKRALGGFHSMQDAMPDDESSYLSSMITDRVSGTTNPASMFYDREDPEMDNVKRSLMPQAPRVAGRGGNPTAPLGGRRSGTNQMRRGLLDDVDRTVSGFQSLKPADVYGRGAQFDPETGYPINQKTGYAFDPVMMMDIDPITHYFLDRKVKLPIDPKTGFCFNRFNGFMYDPESGRAVVFNHREQFLRLEAAKNSQLESMVMQEQAGERLRSQVLGERELDEDGLRPRIDGQASAVGSAKLMNHRRIGCDFEAENEFRPQFQTIPLFRDREGCARDRKTNVGNVKLNFSITETQRRYEEPLPRQLKRMYPTKLYTVRVYVLHGYDMMGTVVKSKLDRSLQGGLEDAGGDGESMSSDWQAQDGDHCNLYLRLRCGNKVVYDSSSSGATDVGDDETMDDKLINVHWNTSNPDFYCCLTLDVALPGVGDMFVEVWDHPLMEKDPASPRPEILTRADKKNPSSLSKIYGSGLHSNNRGCDQLVGWTKIDVEDRLHDSKWKTLESKPIEKRKLWAPTSKHPQGQLEMIVDILPCDKAQYALPLPIETMCPKPLPFELRCIVWKVEELDFRGDYWRKLNDSNPTAQLRLPTHMNMDDVNRKNFYVRATFKDFDIARSPNYLWHSSMKSDTHFDVSANSDKGPYVGEEVFVPLPQKQSRGSKAEDWARIKKRNGDGSYVLVYFEGEKNEFEYKTDLNHLEERINNPSKWRKKVLKEARGGIRKKASVTVNWRFNWKVNLPCNDPRLHLCVRDRREKKKWCEATVNMADIFRLARRTQRAVCYERERSTETSNYVSGQGDRHGGCGPDAFCVKMKHPNHRDTQGLMYCSFEVLPEAESYIRRAGQGRNKPNNLEVGKISTPSRSWDAFCFFFRRLFCSHRWIIFWFVVFVLVIAIIAKCLE
jgi:hypothetical protein